MLFSVIIPVHNAEQYIDRCLQSIFVNDFEDYEILAVENGSTDNSLAILNSYASEHPQIKVFSTSEKGVSNARNIGLDNATGDIITFVDIDDTVAGNYFLEISNSFKAFPEIDALIVNHYDIINGKPVCYKGLGCSRNITGKKVTELLLTHLGGYPWDKAIKRKKINDTRFNKKIYITEDLEFECRLFYSLNVIRISDIPIYNYWINPQSAIRAINSSPNPLHFAVNEATENMIYSYQTISDYFCQKETEKGPIAQISLAIYVDILSTYIISAYIKRRNDIVEQYLPELGRAKKLSMQTLKKCFRKKYFRVQIIFLLIRSKHLRPLAIVLICLNGCFRKIKGRLNRVE